MNKKYFSISNDGKLMDFENTTLPDPFKFAQGVELNRIQNLPNFNMRNSKSYIELDGTFENIQHIESFASALRDVCGKDDRALVKSQDIPYRYICSLNITDKNGDKYSGTGFFISKRCVITSGHCVHAQDMGGWASSIEVIPGRDGNKAPFGKQTSTKFRSVDGWINNADNDFDMGAIILPDNTLYNNIGGYFAYAELNQSVILGNSGYPGDKPSGTQWYNAGSVTELGDYRIKYMIDTASGQSGSPVFLSGTPTTVVGVHCHGGCPNKAVRVRDYVFEKWEEWSRL